MSLVLRYFSLLFLHFWQEKSRLKKSGKAIVITTLTQSIGTFLLVSLVFGIVFHFSGIPVYLAFLFGEIALATAPAPALSIVWEFKTKGPVTSTLIPMAALDDIIGCIVFFTTIAIVAGHLSSGEIMVSESRLQEIMSAYADTTLIFSIVLYKKIFPFTPNKYCNVSDFQQLLLYFSTKKEKIPASKRRSSLISFIILCSGILLFNYFV